MVFVIIPVHNSVNLTIQCLSFLLKQSYSNQKTYVVDNGFTDDTSKTIEKEFAWATVLRGDGDLWWTSARNYGARKTLETAAERQYIFSFLLGLALVLSGLVRKKSEQQVAKTSQEVATF